MTRGIIPEIFDLFRGSPVLNKYYYAVIVDPAANYGHTLSIVQYLGPDGSKKKYKVWKKFTWVKDGEEGESSWVDIIGNDTRSIPEGGIRLYEIIPQRGLNRLGAHGGRRRRKSLRSKKSLRKSRRSQSRK